jgi:hypothetical protein
LDTSLVGWHQLTYFRANQSLFFSPSRCGLSEEATDTNFIVLTGTIDKLSERLDTERKKM